ncbi:MAG: hypothetical protein OEY65_02500, partial [Gammaproteobacteria bacterium]|nr:hypothetical protein [Gammaproteobacteria bacterium]
SGKITGQEIINATSVIYGDSRFDDLKYKLVDFFDVENIEINNDEITMIACKHRVASQSNPYIKNAILVRQKQNILANKFVTFFDDTPWSVQVFYDLDKANNWLGRIPSIQ